MNNRFEPSLCGLQQPFEPLARPSATSSEGYWFIFSDNRLLLEKKGDDFQVPFAVTPLPDLDECSPSRCIGMYGNTPCMLLALEDHTGVTGRFEPVNLRESYSLIPGDFWIIAGRGSQILRWERDNRYCGRCGSPMTEPADEMIKQCPACSFSAYPRISPAVIMSVTRGREILLGRAPRFPAHMYSTLAGFVEPGETAEEAVRREVYEETGITIRNICYLGSQSWPFPHSLMLGFTAEYAEGEVDIDRMELEDARWFSAEDMPRLPSKISISRKLIDIFLEEASAAG